MRLLIQRVNHASVKVDGEVIGNIGKGFLVLVGIGQNDTREIADKYMKKMLGLRIFEDENGKTNLSLADVNGELLMVSQFTLYANCKKGNRPSFVKAVHTGKAVLKRPGVRDGQRGCCIQYPCRDHGHECKGGRPGP